MNEATNNLTPPLDRPSLSLSPGQRAWMRFKSNRRGYISLWIFGILFVACFFAEILCNDKPLIVKYENNYYFPVVTQYAETTFGGDFETEADYKG